MANLPPGHPAYRNPVAAELINPAQAQVNQSLQQTAAQQGVRAEAAQVAANNLLQQTKSALQQSVVAGNPAALPNMQVLAGHPELVNNIGIA